jgi:hypothetical protein
MSIEHSGKPPIYWTTGPRGEKHEIPENAVISLWDKVKKEYVVIGIDEETGKVRLSTGSKGA